MNLCQFTGFPELIAADTGHALILLDTQTGKVQALTAAARTTWRARKGSPAVVTVGAVGEPTKRPPACMRSPSRRCAGCRVRRPRWRSHWPYETLAHGAAPSPG